MRGLGGFGGVAWGWGGVAAARRDCAGLGVDVRMRTELSGIGQMRSWAFDREVRSGKAIPTAESHSLPWNKQLRLTSNREGLNLRGMRLDRMLFVPLGRRVVAVLCVIAGAGFPTSGRAQAPVFEITPVNSTIRFNVKASVKIAGKFDTWNASLTFTSPDETTGVLKIEIDAASVDTGSGMKNGKLKSKDFFDVEANPQITFESTKFVQTGPETYEVDGNFTIRGVSNPEKLRLVVSGKGTGSGEIKGKMVFNRKDYGMNKGIPFIKIADHVEVNIHLKGKRVSGPPLN
jgi:polyisoprenoid-binding protein YceI